MALSSPILNKKPKTTSTRPRGTSTSMDTVKNIQQILIKNGKVRKEILDKKTQFSNKRREQDRRNRKEIELEASNLVIKPSGPIQMIQSSAKGFLERILSFLGYLTAGWLLNNLPTWIAMGKEFIGRVQRMGQLIGGFVTNVENIFTGFGNLLTASFQNLIQFDLFDSSNRLKDAFGQLTTSVDDMGKELEEAIKLITTPLTEGMVTGENAPPTGEKRTYEGAYEPGAPMRVSGGDSDFWTLVAVAAREDSDPQGRADVAQSIYNRLASGAYSGKTIKELILAKTQYQPTWDYPKKGKYGVPNPEWFNIVDAQSASKATGLSVDAINSAASNITNPTLQKNAAEFIGGRTDFKGYRVSGSIQRKSGDNYFGWEYGYKGKIVAPIPNFGINISTSQSTSVPSQSSLPKLPPTDTLKGGVQRYGAKRYGGRRHAGTDFDISGNEKFYSRIGGIVTKVGYDPNGYGHYIDIYNSQLRVYERIAEGARVIVKKGQRISPGQAVVEGEGPTGVIHYEIRKNSGYGFAGTTDPLKFLSNTRISLQSESTQIESIQSQQKQQLFKQLEQERKGQTVIIQQPPEQQSQPIQYISRNSQSETFEIDEFTLVNNFIKNKLLLDLAYL